MVKQQNLINQIHQDMYDYFGNDKKRKSHADSVLKNAKLISESETCDKLIVEVSAILHDIGIHEAERKYNSSAGIYQEKEGPAIAKDILSKYDISNKDIEHICKIISNHHSDKDIATIEFKIIWDADWIVNIPDEFDLNDKIKINKIISKVFKTQKGKELANSKYLE